METKQKFIIKTNAKQFGESFGVYIQNSTEYGHYDIAKNTNDEIFIDKLGNEWKRDNSHNKPRFMRKSGKFEKQLSFTHGQFEATLKEARKLTEELNKNARNCWVKLYHVK